MAQSLVDITVKDQNYILGTYARARVHFVEASGSYLIDNSGKKYLDLGSGISVSALGHQHPKVSQAIEKQLRSFVHVSNLYLNQSQVDLAEILIINTSFDKVFFCNSGTEANEALIKFSRKYWFQKKQAHKTKIISFEDSFHGRSYGALSLTGQDSMKLGFGPMLADIESIPWDDVRALEKLDFTNIAAIILEPIQAEGGINTPSKEFVTALNKIQKDQDVLLLADEIQCSIGRLGYILGSECFGIEPDMVSIAKPIGGGLPLGCVLLKDVQANKIAFGDHGTTFGGNPVACAAGLAVCQEVFTDSFLSAIKEKSLVFKKDLDQFVAEFSCFTKVKGEGLLLGLETTLELPKVLARALDSGLVILRAGSNVIRFLPPLTITIDEWREGMKIFKEVIQKEVQNG